MAQNRRPKRRQTQQRVLQKQFKTTAWHQTKSDKDYLYLQVGEHRWNQSGAGRQRDTGENQTWSQESGKGKLEPTQKKTKTIKIKQEVHTLRLMTL